MKITAQTIVGDLNDEIYLPFALKSVEDFVDGYVIVYTGSKKHKNWDRVRAWGAISKKPVVLVEYPFTNFSEVRNVGLSNTETEWVLRLDSDEVHFQEISRLRDLIALPNTVGIRMYFYHFMQSYDWLEGVYPKVDLFKIVKGTRYEGKVHEQIVEASKGIVIDSGYHYCHYGYTKEASDVYKRWELYAQLEGRPDANIKIVQDSGGIEHILDDRLEKRSKFEGQHPEIIREWIKRHPCET